MHWTEEKKVLLCRAVVARQSYQYKKLPTVGTAAWVQITETLRNEDGFYITTKPIRDHLNLLLVNRKKKRETKKEHQG